MSVNLLARVRSFPFQPARRDESLSNIGCTSALVKASVGIQSPEFFPEKNQRKLLSSLFNVTTLKLGGFGTAALFVEESGEFPKFANLQTLLLGECFLDKYGVDLQLKVLGSFIQNAPCLEKLTLWCCMFDENPEMEWDSKRKSINLQRHNRKALQCQKLKVVEVIYENDHNHRLVDLLWGITRRLPDASIKLTKI